jgi:hypothetical protein
VGGTVVVIDRCGPERAKASGLKVQMYGDEDLEPGTQIIQYNRGKKYEVSNVKLLFYKKN